MRVLILADDCNPDWPSLPVVGYNAARAIAEHAEVVVATHIRNRSNIESVGFGRAQVIYIDNEYIAAPLFKLGGWLRGGHATGWTTAIAMAYPSYLAFEWEVWRKTSDQLRQGRFDVVHRLTPMSPTLPSPMAAWSPVPFVLGPLNGGLPWPAAFREELAREREWLSYFRGFYRMLPYQRSTYRNASAILAAFQHTIDDLPVTVRSKVIEFAEVGIDPNRFFRTAEQPRRTRKNILFVGRFVPYKLPQAVVQAFAREPLLRRHKLIMVGDGPERPAIEDLVRRHGLTGCVELVGWKTQAEVGDLMRSSDILAFPSIRELGAGAVLEAMACGMVCVVVDYGGPGVLVGEDRGVKIPLTDRDQLVVEFGRALVRLISRDEDLVALGTAASEFAMREYTWDAKARKIVSLYKQLVHNG